MSGSLDNTASVDTASQVLWTARLLTHMRKPENLITYLILTAWMKFMGVASHIPTITVG